MKQGSKEASFRKRYYLSSCSLILSATFFSFSIKELEHIEAHSVVTIDSTSENRFIFSHEEYLLPLSDHAAFLKTSSSLPSEDVELKQSLFFLPSCLRNPLRLPINKYKELAKKNSKHEPLFSSTALCYEEDGFSFNSLFLPTLEKGINYSLTWKPLKTFKGKESSCDELKKRNTTPELFLYSDLSISLKPTMLFSSKKQTFPSVSFFHMCKEEDSQAPFLPFAVFEEPTSIDLRAKSYILSFLEEEEKNLDLQLQNTPLKVDTENHGPLIPDTKALKSPKISLAFYPSLKKGFFSKRAIEDTSTEILISAIHEGYTIDVKELSSYHFECTSSESSWPIFRKSALELDHPWPEAFSIIKDPFCFYETELRTLEALSTHKITAPSSCNQEYYFSDQTLCYAASKNKIDWSSISLRSAQDLKILEPFTALDAVELAFNEHIELFGKKTFEETLLKKISLKRRHSFKSLPSQENFLFFTSLESSFLQNTLEPAFENSLERLPWLSAFSSWDTKFLQKENIVYSSEFSFSDKNPCLTFYKEQLISQKAFKKKKDILLSAPAFEISLSFFEDCSYTLPALKASPCDTSALSKYFFKNPSQQLSFLSKSFAYKVIFKTSSHPKLYFLETFESPEKVELPANAICLDDSSFFQNLSSSLSNDPLFANKQITASEPYTLIFDFEVEGALIFEHTCSLDLSFNQSNMNPPLALIASYEKKILPLQDCKEHLFPYLPTLQPLIFSLDLDPKLERSSYAFEEIASLDRWIKTPFISCIRDGVSKDLFLNTEEKNLFSCPSDFLTHDKKVFYAPEECLANSLEDKETSENFHVSSFSDDSLTDQVAFLETGKTEFVFGASYEDFGSFLPVYKSSNLASLELRSFRLIGLSLAYAPDLDLGRKTFIPDISIDELSQKAVSENYPLSLCINQESSYFLQADTKASKEPGSYYAFDLVKKASLQSHPLYAVYSHSEEDFYLQAMRSPAKKNLITTSCHDLSFSSAAAMIVNHTLKEDAHPLSDTLKNSSYYSYNPSDDFTIDVQIAPNNKEGGYLFSILLEPKGKKLETHCPQNYLFLIDRSGSIDKTRFQTFKQAIAKSLTYLSEEDTFNILTFDSEITKMSHSSVYVTSSTKHAAKRFLENQNKGYQFATPNLYELLLDLQPMVKKSSLPTTIVLLTSGKTVDEFSYDDPLLKTLLKERSKGFTLFTAGCSESSDSLALEMMSTLNKGEFMHSQTNAAFPRKLAGMIKHASYLAATDIHLNIASFAQNSKVSLFPKTSLAPHLYGDRPYTIVGKIDKLCDFDLVLQGKFCENWLFVKKKVSFASAKHGGHSVFKDYKAYLAHDRFCQYVEGGDICHLDEAKKLLQPITMKAFH